MQKPDRRTVLRGAAITLLGSGWGIAQRQPDCNCAKGSDGMPLDTGMSEIRPVIERYDVELRDLNRVFALPGSATRHSRLTRFYTEQLRLLDSINFDALGQAGKIDYLMLRERLLREQKQLVAEGGREDEVASLIPFQQTIMELEESRRRMETIDPQKSALALQKLNADIAAAKEALPGSKAPSAVMNRAAVRLAQLRNYFHTWHDFYHLYDPKFAWWVDAEYKLADEALDAHAQALHTASGVPGPLDAGVPGGFGDGRGGRGGRGGAAGGNAEGGGTVSARFSFDGINDGVGGAADFQTFVLPSSFTNLTAVEFVALDATGSLNSQAFFDVDNIVVTPEPKTLWLAGTTIAFLLRRRLQSRRVTLSRAAFPYGDEKTTSIGRPLKAPIDAYAVSKATQQEIA